MTSPPPPSLRSRLREQTKPLHDRVEALAGLPQSREQHEALLARFYGFLKPWQPRVWATLSDRPSVLHGREKVALIESDLAALGWSDVRRNALPVCARLPDVSSEAAALGSLYVFEGATLGGQILARHVESKLGLANGIGYRFHRAYGDQTGVMWSRFQSELAAFADADDAPPARADAIVAAAVETFERVYDWFSQSKGGH